jgi:hypothetical protein
VFFAADEERLVVVDVIEALMADAERAVPTPVPAPPPVPVPEPVRVAPPAARPKLKAVPRPAAEPVEEPVKATLPTPRASAEDDEAAWVDTPSLLRELHGLNSEEEPPREEASMLPQSPRGFQAF